MKKVTFKADVPANGYSSVGETYLDIEMYVLNEDKESFNEFREIIANHRARITVTIEAMEEDKHEAGFGRGGGPVCPGLKDGE